MTHIRIYSNSRPEDPKDEVTTGVQTKLWMIVGDGNLAHTFIYLVLKFSFVALNLPQRHVTENRLMVATESGNGMKVKVAK